MGGRLDATNIIKPALSIISNISLEHQMYLGNSIAQIAVEKGGIIKKNAPVVTGVQQKNAISVLKEIADAQSAPFYRYKDAFRVRRKKDNAFTYIGIANRWENMQTRLLGNYQVDNAALVLAACEVLSKNTVDLPLKNIRDGLAQNRWPGRLDIVSTSPLIILDGAHNLMAVRNLARFLSEKLSDRKITLVAGVMDDKSYPAMLQSLLPLCSRAIFTQAKIDHAVPPDTLSAVAKTITPNIEVFNDVEQAVKHAVKTASPDDAICIAGSLYVVGEAKEVLDKIL
jgi:dihydrofolate synthase/folylpolyglutamate synthase